MSNDVPRSAWEVFMDPSGPAHAARLWLEAVVDDGDLARVWAITDLPLRTALLQKWIYLGMVAGIFTRDQLVSEMERTTAHPAWPAFEAWRVERWRRGSFSKLASQGWSVVAVQEIAGPDLELIRVAAGRQPVDVRPGVPIVAQAFVMRFVEAGWQVAGIGRRLPVPGWPPGEMVVPTDLDRPSSEADL